MSPARLEAIPEDSLCFDDADELAKELGWSIALVGPCPPIVSRRLWRTISTTVKFPGPHAAQEGRLAGRSLTTPRLENFVEIWALLKLPQDTNFLLSREIIRSRKRDVIVKELSEAQVAFDAVESAMKKGCGLWLGSSRTRA